MASNLEKSIANMLGLPDLPDRLMEDLDSWIEEPESEQDRVRRRLAVKIALFSGSPNRTMPVDNVYWVPVEKVTPNDWNPNAVAGEEMNLLYVSISQDGVTMPIVTFYNDKTEMFEIVDGFHRYTTLRKNKDLLERTSGYLPIVVIDKDVNDRMASTVRHNRARGKHSVAGMSSMVYDMLKNGWKDDQICNELGMSADELVRLKHMTGFSKLFKDAEFRKEWKIKTQIKAEKNYKLAKEELAKQGIEFDPFNQEHQDMVKKGIKEPEAEPEPTLAE